jgi:hypothetical protein
MSDYYLKFSSRDAAIAALEAAGMARNGVVPEGSVFVDGSRFDIHTVGVIMDPTGEGFDVVFVPQEGWHVNVRTDSPITPLPSGLAQYEVNPSTPRSVWA